MLIVRALARCPGREAARTEEHTARFIFCIMVNVVSAGIEYKRRAMTVSDEDLENTVSCTRWVSSSQRELTWAAFDIAFF